MVSTYTHGKLTWIDLESPTHNEIKEIADKYNIDPIVADDLLSPSIRPSVELSKDYIYLVLHFPNTNFNSLKTKANQISEIDFIIGKKFIITNRYSDNDALLEFSKIFEVDSILKRTEMSKHAGFIFFYMIQSLYRDLFNKLEHVKDLLKDAEDHVFHDKEKEMVVTLSHIHRVLLNFKSSIFLHKEILENFIQVGKEFYGTDFRHHLKSILSEYLKLQTEVEGAKEYLNELKDTNNSLLSTKQNEIMKNLTIVTFVFLPLSLIAGIFGMNTHNMPFIGHPHDFIIVLFVMAITTSTIFLFFRFTRLL